MDPFFISILIGFGTPSHGNDGDDDHGVPLLIPGWIERCAYEVEGIG